MKKILLGAVAIVAIGIAPSLAADLPAKTYTKAPPMVAAANDWSGFYVGGSIGERWTDTDWRTTGFQYFGQAVTPPDPTTASTTFKTSGFHFGGYAGYNWQWSNVVAGLEGSIGGVDQSKTTRADFPGTLFGPTNGLDHSSAASDIDGSIRGRVGYLVLPTMLAYATGGLAVQRVTFGVDCRGVPGNNSMCNTTNSDSRSAVLTGWTIGGGLEAMFGSHWVARLEYSYADFGNRQISLLNTALVPGPNTGDPAVFASTRVSTQTLSVGLAYKFGGPVVARY
jgi:outer membrane immunogenic protein